MSEAGSGIEGLRADSTFVRYVAKNLSSEYFKLLDIGCAGGLPSGWRAFGDRLAARGFDINAQEVSRLNAAERNPNVNYECGFVGLPDGHPLKDRIGDKAYWHMWVDKRLAYERTYQLRAAKDAGRDPLSVEDYFREVVLAQDWSPHPVHGFDTNYARDHCGYIVSTAEVEAEQEGRAPERTIYLPAYARAFGFDDVDFIKLDIDGPDWEVLRSAGSLLERPTLLGVALEVCFYGSHDANDNSFHNTDRLMRAMGFDLFGLSTRTYASAAMPWPYLDTHPSMNTGGRPVQGDAIYIRDLASRARKSEAELVSGEKLLKQAALLALFRLPDHAAEVLIVHRERLAGIIDVDLALDLLASEIQEDQPTDLPYRGYMEQFELDAPSFFDNYSLRNAWMAGLLESARSLPLLQEQLTTAEAIVRDSELRLRQACNEIKNLRAEIGVLKRESSAVSRPPRLDQMMSRILNVIRRMRR